MIATASDYRDTDALTAVEATCWPGKVDLFGVRCTPTTYDEAERTILTAARRGEGAIVSCHAVHALVTSSCDADLGDKVNTFDMVIPDGQPIRWALNWLHGAGLQERVYGPDLMLRLCAGAERMQVSIYLYGGSPSVLDKLYANLERAFPQLSIAGAYSPPFRPLTAKEDQAVVDRIRASGAGLVFVGLGCPKQDLFAYAHRSRIPAVQVCVGAAFDFHAGVKGTAPPWMQRHGLEWFYRLASEPRRLWRRYLVTNSIFVWKLANGLVRHWCGKAPRQPINGSP